MGFSIDFYFQYHKGDGETLCILRYVAMNYQSEYELQDVHYI